jgi:hypothetical protein
VISRNKKGIFRFCKIFEEVEGFAEGEFRAGQGVL